MNRLAVASVAVLVVSSFASVASASNETSLYSWGTNWDRQLGTGTPFTQVYVAPAHNVLGQIVEVSTPELSDVPKQDPLEPNRKLPGIDDTENPRHVLARRSDGTVLAWGNNESLQCGVTSFSDVPIPSLVSGLSEIIQVAAGSTHSLALRGDGTVFAWGSDGAGELGQGSTGGSTATPLAVTLPVSARAIAAGTRHSVALLTDGSVWAWGENQYGQLGLGYTSADEPRPMLVKLPMPAVAISTGDSHSLALLEDGSVASWGWNRTGQLGCSIPSPAPDYEETPCLVVQITGPKLMDVVQIEAGGTFSLARVAGGKVFGWGSNKYGQLSSTTFPARGYWFKAWELTPLAGAVNISAGGDNALAVMGDGTLVAFGHCGSANCGTGNGVGNPAYYTTAPEAVLDVYWVSFIEAGDDDGFALAPSRTGYAEATGANGFGQLGDFGWADRSIPYPIIGSMFGVSGSMDLSLGLHEDGYVFSWGNNDRGQLGLGFAGGTYNSPQFVSSIDNVAQVATGIQSSLVLRHDGTVWGWGANGDGELGDGTRIDALNPVQALIPARIVRIASGHYHSLALDETGGVWSWGSDMNESLGSRSLTSPELPELVAIPANIVAISAGWSHSYALDEDGQVWAWGANNVAQLGMGCVLPNPWPIPLPPNACPYSRRTAEKVMVSSTEALTGVTDIAAGGWLGVALQADGTVVRWGDEIGNPRWLGVIPDDGMGSVFAVDAKFPSGAVVTDLGAGWVHGIGLGYEYLGGPQAAWAFGSGATGELGDGSATDSQLPLRVKLDRPVATGPAGNHSLFIQGRPPPQPCNPSIPGTCG